MNKKIIAIIPARYASSRFPGKPLALLNGIPMVQWVYNATSRVNEIDATFVATDDTRIFESVTNFGGNAIMTSEKHQSGTDRLAEAILQIPGKFDIVLNIQGDEPMIRTEMIWDLISAFEDDGVYMATLKKEITELKDIQNPNIAKLITDREGYAIYFSRSTIPFNRDGIGMVKYFKHIGVYGYTKEFLLKFTSLPQTSLEESEKLEQLRVIENGYKIKVIETKHDSIGVDLPEHILQVEEAIRN